MKRLIYMCLVGFCTCGWGQQTHGDRFAVTGNENLRIFTDRNIYMAGEELNFRVFNVGADSLFELSMSRVFYAELISPDGFSHTRAKYNMGPGGTGGVLKVPTEIPSGNYFLKGYTRWMRNYGPENYSYVSVQIINPFQRELLSVDTTSRFSVQLQKKTCVPGMDGMLAGNPEVSYSRRARVRLNLMVPGDHPAAHCCVSVIRDGMLAMQWESMPSSSGLQGNGIEQIPETRGISLAGKVETEGTGLPAPYAVVYLSLMGKEGDFFANYADSAGRFYFALPDRNGETDLYISASHSSPGELELFIEQDFCTEPVSLPSLPLQLDGKAESLIYDMLMNAQIRNRYDGGPEKKSDFVEAPRIFFYGAPSTTVWFEDFIKLPTMEEYFTEVTPKVSLRRSNGVKKFRVLGNHPDLAFYEPLVMIDGVAIFKVESVLALSPRYVDRVEIVDSPYIRGNVTFGGIINIITRKGDMGFIDLPSSGLLLNYTMYTDMVSGDQILQPSDPRVPDVRNTLYWDPDLELVPGEQKEISFLTSDVPGKYHVAIRGVDSSGSCFEESIQFRVE